MCILNALVIAWEIISDTAGLNSSFHKEDVINIETDAPGPYPPFYLITSDHATMAGELDCGGQAVGRQTPTRDVSII